MLSALRCSLITLGSTGVINSFWNLEYVLFKKLYFSATLPQVKSLLPKEKIYLIINADLANVFDLELEHRNAEFTDLRQ